MLRNIPKVKGVVRHGENRTPIYTRQVPTPSSPSSENGKLGCLCRSEKRALVATAVLLPERVKMLLHQTPQGPREFLSWRKKAYF